MQQPALETRALFAQVAILLFRPQDHRRTLAPGRAKGQVGKIEIDRVGTSPAARADQLAIDRQEPEGLIVPARNDCIEIGDQRLERPGSDSEHFGSAQALFALAVGEQSLQFLGYAGHAVQADDRECAVRLVQVRACELDPGVVGTARAVGAQPFQSAGYRSVDLALDPGQRPGIEAGAAVHPVRRSDTMFSPS